MWSSWELRDDKAMTLEIVLDDFLRRSVRILDILQNNLPEIRAAYI
jgi:hypothetical protein